MILPGDIPGYRWPASTEAIIEQLSSGSKRPIGRDAEHLALGLIIDRRECPLCGAWAGWPCRVYGAGTIRRTHPARLTMTDTERAAVVAWSTGQANRLARIRAADDEEAK